MYNQLKNLKSNEELMDFAYEHQESLAQDYYAQLKSVSSQYNAIKDEMLQELEPTMKVKLHRDINHLVGHVLLEQHEHTLYTLIDEEGDTIIREVERDDINTHLSRTVLGVEYQELDYNDGGTGLLIILEVGDET